LITVRSVRIGVLLLPTDPWPETLERVRRIEALGYDHVWTYDHLSWRRYRDRPWHAAIPWLTGVAAATERIRLGTMVASPNFRHPVTLAKDAMTLDHVSGGRLTLGIGAGGTGFDATVLGDAPLSASQRSARFAEFTALLDRLLREPVTDHRGEHYVVDGARMRPGCVQQPRVPIAVAAAGPRGLALAARHADAWITYGDPDEHRRSAADTDAAVREQSERLDEACALAGRDPSSIDRVFLAGNTEARPTASVNAFDDLVERYAEIGFTDVVFHHPRADDPVWDDPPSIVEDIARARGLL
jgi:alkanesulfonate monooxygenase SsuD/methylene tetrahydromethanopterin reductase-like flavin-dependent oxidoreductase (luciferase family)